MQGVGHGHGVGHVQGEGDEHGTGGVRDMQNTDSVTAFWLCLKQLQSQPLKLTEQGQLLEQVIVAAATALIQLKDTLNEWDTKVGDGDCGSTMYKGATAVLGDMKNYPLNDAAETVGEIGSTIGKSMGGTSGIIYSILCKAACAQLKTSSHSVITSKQWAKALAAAIEAVSKYGGAKVGYRTLLDALIPALSSLEERLYSGDDPATAFLTSSQAALNGAESTKTMRAKLETVSYGTNSFYAGVQECKKLPGYFMEWINLKELEFICWLCYYVGFAKFN
ncbi:hypothetical protein RYX36_011196 [Vicia faba]